VARERRAALFYPFLFLLNRGELPLINASGRGPKRGSRPTATSQAGSRLRGRAALHYLRTFGASFGSPSTMAWSPSPRVRQQLGSKQRVADPSRINPLAEPPRWDPPLLPGHAGRRALDSPPAPQAAKKPSHGMRRGKRRKPAEGGARLGAFSKAGSNQAPDSRLRVGVSLETARFGCTVSSSGPPRGAPGAHRSCAANSSP